MAELLPFEFVYTKLNPSYVGNCISYQTCEERLCFRCRHIFIKQKPCIVTKHNTPWNMSHIQVKCLASLGDIGLTVRDTLNNSSLLDVLSSWRRITDVGLMLMLCH